jgi:cytochrome c5
MILMFYLIGCSGEQQVGQIQISDYPEYDTESAKLYISKCSGCHAAPLPGVHDIRQWAGIVQRMQMRMANKAITPLNKQELTAVVEYLEKHARK